MKEKKGEEMKRKVKRVSKIKRQFVFYYQENVAHTLFVYGTDAAKVVIFLDLSKKI